MDGSVFVKSTLKDVVYVRGGRVSAGDEVLNDDFDSDVDAGVVDEGVVADGCVDVTAFAFVEVPAVVMMCTFSPGATGFVYSSVCVTPFSVVSTFTFTSPPSEPELMRVSICDEALEAPVVTDCPLVTFCPPVDAEE